jgi:glyoxylase-like metal-dependent hydrolase (beta-lactamase superfamily II)
MRVHHLNCISSCPLGGRLMDHGPESVLERAHVTNHCLLIEDRDQLILADTGFGLEDVRDPHSRLSEFFLTLNKPDFRDDLTAFNQIKALGFDPRDVRHIVLTHLDFDHAGGLDDFPTARIHMLQAESESARAQKTWLDRQRYRPQQWRTQPNWIGYEPGEGESWFGFAKVRALDGVPPDVVMLPLIGHTLGHAGIAIDTDQGWLLLAGDAYFYHAEMDLENPHCTAGLTMYQLMMDKDHDSRVWNQDRLRALKRDTGDRIRLFCSHDVVEFEKLAGHGADESPRARSSAVASPRDDRSVQR